MKVILMRHGQSYNNLKLNLPAEQYETSRDPDPDLSDVGRQQVRVASEYLKNLGNIPSMVFCSPQKRAIETAMICNDILQSPITVIPTFHEVGGLFHKDQAQKGHSLSKFKELYPTVYFDPLITEEGWFLKDSKESVVEADSRTQNILNYLLSLSEQYYDQQILIVSHGGLMDKILGQIVKREQGSGQYFYHQNTGMTFLHFDQKHGIIIDQVNNYEHLKWHCLKTGQNMIEKNENLKKKKRV